MVEEEEEKVEEEKVEEEEEEEEAEVIPLSVQPGENEPNALMDELHERFEAAQDLKNGEKAGGFIAIVQFISDNEWKAEDQKVVDTLKRRCRDYVKADSEDNNSTGAKDDIETLLKSDLELVSGSSVISYTRLLWRATLHWLGWEKVRAEVIALVRKNLPPQPNESESAYLERVCGDEKDQRSQGLCYLFRFFDIDLKTGVGAFRIFDDGDISDVLSRLGMITAQLCYYKKNKIASTMLTTIDQLLHLKDHHRDVFDLFCEVSRVACADEIQEFFNSRYGGLANSPCIRTDEYLKDLSLLQNFIGPIKEVTIPKKNKKKTTELERRFNRALKPENAASIDRIGKFILQEFQDVLLQKEGVHNLKPVDKEKLGMTMAKGVFWEIEHTAGLFKAKEVKPKRLKVADYKDLVKELEAWHNTHNKDRTPADVEGSVERTRKLTDWIDIHAALEDQKSAFWKKHMTRSGRLVREPNLEVKD